MIHEYGAKEEFSIDFNEGHSCIIVEYFSLTGVIISINEQELELEVIIRKIN